MSDEYELAMLAGAAERDLPMLAICRGMQALNVSRGGTLHQHLPDLTALDHSQSARPFAPTHSVSVAPGSLLHRLADADCSASTRTTTRPSIASAPAWRSCASAPDGTVEAVWDPARGSAPASSGTPRSCTHRADHAPLFESLVAAARPTAPALALVA